MRITEEQQKEIDMMLYEEVRRWYINAFITLGPDAQASQLQTTNLALMHGIAELIHALRIMK